MILKGIELAAMVSLGMAMAQADGHVDDVEKSAIALELLRFGVSQDGVGSIIAAAAAMDAAAALGTITAMSNEQKKYVTGYLAAVMAADGNIDNEEVKLWQLICTLANFPKMSLSQALDFWKNN